MWLFVKTAHVAKLDKASAYEAGDYRFESCCVRSIFFKLMKIKFSNDVKRYIEYSFFIFYKLNFGKKFFFLIQKKKFNDVKKKKFKMNKIYLIKQ